MYGQPSFEILQCSCNSHHCSLYELDVSCVTRHTVGQSVRSQSVVHKMKYNNNQNHCLSVSLCVCYSLLVRAHLPKKLKKRVLTIFFHRRRDGYVLLTTSITRTNLLAYSYTNSDNFLFLFPRVHINFNNNIVIIWF